MNTHVTIPGESRKTGADVVAAVKAMLPEIRAAQGESDRLSRPAEHIVKKLREAGVYRLMFRKEYGGIEGTAKDYMDVVTEIGKGDAGTAWAVSLDLSNNWLLSSFFPKHLTDEVLADPDANLAGVYTGRALKSRPMDGGIFIEKGTWFFNSGVYQATWDLLGVTMYDENGNEAGPGIALLPIEQVTKLNDWDTIGIRGSGSTNVTVENVFVPKDRILSLAAMVKGEQPRAYDRPLARAAFQPLMVVLLTFPVLGASLHMIEKFVEALPNRSIRGTPYTKAGEAPVTHLVLGEATAKIETARLVIENIVKEIDDWSQTTEYMSQLDRARLCRDCAFSERLMWEGVDLLAQASGGTFTYHSNILNRLWRDVKAGNMHPFISSLTNYEMYGRMLAGVQPPLIHI